jgi:hypothetical protein
MLCYHYIPNHDLKGLYKGSVGWGELANPNTEETPHVFALTANTRRLGFHPLLTVAGVTSPPVTAGFRKTNINTECSRTWIGRIPECWGSFHPNLRTAAIWQTTKPQL